MTKKEMDFTTEQFNGPLDLLLEMIEDEKLDITEISLAKIADQYIAYVQANKYIDPDEVANFLVVAARLLLIKSKTLLPYLMREEEEEEIRDFENQLKIYKDFLEASRTVEEFLAREQFAHAREQFKGDMLPDGVFFPPPNVSVGVLQSAAREIAERFGKVEQPAEERMLRAVSIDERITAIVAALKKINELSFSSLMGGETTRIDVIVNFIAVLELMKRRTVDVRQKALFDDFTITVIS